MLDPKHPIAELLRRDDRYHFDAYVFVFEALRYAQEKLGLGSEIEASEIETDEIETDEVETGKLETGELETGELGADFSADEQASSELGPDEQQEAERHVTGQELCEAMRLYAHDQYGYMAKSVLNHWGIGSTGDFGEIVFNLIEIQQMRKTVHDRREDFEEVFDFDEGFQHNFQFNVPDSSEEPRH